MNWRDLFYYSRGERRALTLLLFIITLSGILLSISNLQQKDVAQKKITEQYIVNPENAPKPIPIDTVMKLPLQQNNRTVNKTPSTQPYAEMRQSFPKTEKYPAGTKVELNTADTTSLKKVPGIGTAFANRIVKYRDLLGGFYKVEQLHEVYGIDEEKFNSLKDWFYVDTAFIAKLPVNYMPLDWLRKHPYLNYQQARAICDLRKSKVLSDWENLNHLAEFTEDDIKRLQAYISFYYKN